MTEDACQLFLGCMSCRGDRKEERGERRWELGPALIPFIYSFCPFAVAEQKFVAGTVRDASLCPGVLSTRSKLQHKWQWAKLLGALSSLLKGYGPDKGFT